MYNKDMKQTECFEGREIKAMLRYSEDTSRAGEKADGALRGSWEREGSWRRMLGMAQKIAKTATSNEIHNEGILENSARTEGCRKIIACCRELDRLIRQQIAFQGEVTEEVLREAGEKLFECYSGQWGGIYSEEAGI